MSGYYRRRKRTGTKRKGFKKTKPRATMSTAMVKRLIRSEQETKHVDANLNFYLTGVELPSGISMIYKNEGVTEASFEAHPHIASGAAAYQRIGNKVYVQSMTIKWLLQHGSTIEAPSPYDHPLARILVVLYQDVAPNAGGCLDYADDYGTDSPVFAHYKSTATNSYKVLYDRTFAPGSTVQGGASTDIVKGGESWMIQKRISINREVSFNSNASATPGGYPIVVYAFHDGGTWSMRGSTRFTFKDA